MLLEILLEEERKAGHDSGLKEGHETGLREGREAGLKEGHETGFAAGQKPLVAICCRKLKDGMSPKEILHLLGTDTEGLADILETAGRFAPEYDPDRVCAALYDARQSIKENDAG